MVFEHLVAKGLFRIGFDLECPTCALSSWTPIDSVRQSMTCTLCGADYDATRQLVDRPSAYRRSGVLGLEKNTLGAVPVATLLQQLSVNFFLGSYKMHFGTSYDLSPADATSGLPTCETDFVVVSGSLQSDKVVVLIGECKDRAGKIDSDDFENLRQVADAFPASRFAVFMVFAKLGPFNLDEIEGAKELNAKWGKRVILMTHRELEPYHIYDRTNKELGLELHGSTPDELADATDLLYFEPAPN
jgi:hypothetical protein